MYLEYTYLKMHLVHLKAILVCVAAQTLHKLPCVLQFVERGPAYGGEEDG